MHRAFRVGIWLVAILTGVGSVSARADIHPLVRMEFQVQARDLDDLMEILTSYAGKAGFTVEDIGSKMPPKDNRPIFYVNLTRPDSVKITVTNFLKRNEVFLLFYAPDRGLHPENAISPLISQIRKKWPDIRPYTGP